MHPSPSSDHYADPIATADQLTFEAMEMSRTQDPLTPIIVVTRVVARYLPTASLAARCGAIDLLEARPHTLTRLRKVFALLEANPRPVPPLRPGLNGAVEPVLGEFEARLKEDAAFLSCTRGACDSETLAANCIVRLFVKTTREGKYRAIDMVRQEKPRLEIIRMLERHLLAAG
jgi:hypothetical protein